MQPVQDQQQIKDSNGKVDKGIGHFAKLFGVKGSQEEVTKVTGKVEQKVPEQSSEFNKFAMLFGAPKVLDPDGAP